MVAVRRIKHLVQLSAVGLLVLTFVIFIQWDEISYTSRLKRQVSGFREQLEYMPDSDLSDLERELDVDRILKKIHDDVTQRLLKEEEEEEEGWNKTKQELATSTSNNQDKHANPEMKLEIPFSTTKTKPENRATVSSTNNVKTNAHEKKHRRHLKHFQWQPFPWKPNMRGQLNVHIWQAWCGNAIHDLRRNWFFPSYPDLHLTVNRFFVRHSEDDYGQRIFGFIHPPLTGQYVFALSSDDASELWLSTNELPDNVRLLAWVGNRTGLGGYHRTSIGHFTKYKTQLSKQVYLKKGRRYFIEALHKQGAREDHILVGWKIPGLSRFRYISGDSISMYIDDSYTSPDVTEYAKYIPKTIPSHAHSHFWSVTLNRHFHKFGSSNEPNEFRPHQLVQMKYFYDVLPECGYQPSYLVNFTLKRYEGVKLIHDSAVYPDDLTILTHMIPYDQCKARRMTDSHGNGLNVHVPTLTNHSLFHEGKIKVFGPDGNGSVVTTLSDLDEDYPSNHVLKFDESNATDQRNVSLGFDGQIEKEQDAHLQQSSIRTPRPLQSQHQVIYNKHNVDIKESTKLLNGIQEHPVPLQNQMVERKHLEQKVPSEDDIRRRDESELARQRLEAFMALSQAGQNEAKNDPGNKSPHSKRGERTNEQSNNKRRTNLDKRDQSLGKRRTMLNNSRYEKSNVRNKPRLSQTFVRSNDKTPFSSKSEPRSQINDHNQRKEKRSYEKRNAKRNSPARKEESKKENQYEMKGNSRRNSRRKLLYYQTEKENTDKDKDTDAQVHNAKNTHDAVPRFYFRQIGTMAVKKHNRSDFMYEDSRLSRLNSAREYVRRMQTVIQIYQHPMSARQISNQIYRRYGIRIRVPEMQPYLDYNPLLYHHNTTKCASDGNLLLNEDVAKSVVSRYMKELTMKTANKYSLQRIINVQENHDVMYGDRYLMELELLDQIKNKTVRLSQYLYQENGQQNLCFPHHFQIDHHATVHVIVPVKNQGRWVQYFIDDMSEIYLKTRDPHLNVIIVDFSSDDIDVEEALRRSPLVRYKVITLSGPFQRAFGIQAGSTAVKNPNDIIFMCDLHLELPNNMIDIIRKHCIRGKMAFAPVVTRLHCGFTPTVPFGFWELQGYGLFAMYKYDFTRVGGMNYREFGTRWGGEDWELLDRVLLKKLEVERLRIPNFYHFYHSKKGMWGTPTTDAVMSDITADSYRDENKIIPLYKPRLVTVSPSRRSKVPQSNQQRQLRKKRRPSRAIRPPSRVRRGYRPRKRQKPVEIELERAY